MNESRCSVVLLVDESDNILLYLRDDKPSIVFPNAWALLGGILAAGETPEDGLRREVREELGLRDGTPYELQACEYLFAHPRKDIVRTEYVFKAALSETVANLTLHEGQRLGLFGRAGIIGADDIVPHHKEIILRYFELEP